MFQALADITLGAGRYSLRAPLASSAYGVVWRARAPCGADVAIKLINREQMARCAPAQRTRWIASARTEIAFLDTLSPWDGRHIVRLLDNGVHEGLPALALELMDGDLAAHLASGARPTPAQALEWTGQVNQALAKVHQYGWHYLDLKPANVLLSGGVVKLADFGTSRLRTQDASASYTGTASWQAPEQFFPGTDGQYRSDARSDYFALGALLYFLVTGGQQLHYCRSCGDAWRAHQKQAPRCLLEQWGGSLPATLTPSEAARFGSSAGEAALGLLRQLLAADPNARPRHALAISRLLDAARRSLP
jgi:serine/threonine-protein kinase